MAEEIRVVLEENNPIRFIADIDDNPIQVNIVDIDEDSINISLHIQEEITPVTINMTESPLELRYIDVASIGPAGADAITAWITYVVGYSVAPFLLATLDSGQVYQYEYSDESVLYRYIATDASEDSFYSSFEDGILSDLLVTKQI